MLGRATGCALRHGTKLRTAANNYRPLAKLTCARQLRPDGCDKDASLHRRSEEITDALRVFCQLSAVDKQDLQVTPLILRQLSNRHAMRLAGWKRNGCDEQLHSLNVLECSERIHRIEERCDSEAILFEQVLGAFQGCLIVVKQNDLGRHDHLTRTRGYELN